jgi:hypothetical protein
MSGIEVKLHLRRDIKVSRNINEELRLKNFQNAEDRYYAKYHN